MTTPPRQSQPGAGSETNSSVPAARQEAQPVAWFEPTQFATFAPDAYGLFDAVASLVRTEVCTLPLYAAPAPEQVARDAARLRFLLDRSDVDDAALWAEVASLSGIDSRAARAAIDSAMAAPPKEPT